MEELIKRAADLKRRSEMRGILTHTNFLTPAESYEIGRVFKDALFSGGRDGCERTAAFFLPEYMEPEYFDPGEYIKAVRAEAKFSKLTHRDYLGAVLGLGITRESVGDIFVFEDSAYIFCLPTVLSHIVLSLDKVGRYGCKCEEVPLDSVPASPVKRKEVTFSVMSPRLDAVIAGMFNLARGTASKLIDGGFVTLNYKECLKGDREVKEGDIITARGCGKGEITSLGGTSRRGRTFMTAEIYK